MVMKMLEWLAWSIICFILFAGAWWLGSYLSRRLKEHQMYDKCKYCGLKIYFNPKTRKWVTSENNWKCKSDPALPVRSHEVLRLHKSPPVMGSQ